MSIGIGTLQPKSRIMRPVWVGGLVGFALALSFAVIVANYEEPAGSANTTVSRPVVNTPTELSGGVASPAFGTAANTPTELRAGFVGSYAGTATAVVPHVPRRGVEAQSVGARHGTTGNTPTELSGGLPAPADLNYVPIVVNGEVFWRTVP